MNSFLRLILSPFQSKPDPREAMRPLWASIIALARQPRWYAEHHVADSVTGRFDMVTLVTALVLLRMERSPDLAAASALITELFVEDMDGQLREFGVGDMVVGKRIGRLVSTLGGRIGALRDTLPKGGTALCEALERNVTLQDGATADSLADAIAAQAEALARIADADLVAGRLDEGSK